MATTTPPMDSVAAFRFDNSFARELPGFYVPWRPAVVPAPRLLYLNHPLAAELGIDLPSLDGPAGAAVFAGSLLPAGAEPLAQAYAGHQFGGFSPQLGDGRALLLGEVIDRQGRRRDIAFKGSGRTPFARGGDGKAALGPMLREVLLGEAMHALGIPTTRALAVAATGEPVYRDHILPGAVLTRVAASHLRVGTFEFHAARGDLEPLRQLAEYTIARHDPALVAEPQSILAFLQNVAERQSALIAQWMNVGFIHGVMNTDNMAISGETIDYGPCAFMEAYDPAAVFSSIDHQGRYAFGNQPAIARWNLARLAEALLPLLSADPDQALAMATEVVDAFPAQYRRHLLRGQRAKLGLRRAEPGDDSADAALAEDWLALLHAGRVDFTLGWRRLADAAAGDEAPLRALFDDARAPDAWLARWRARCASECDSAAHGSALAGSERARTMRSVNPYVIARNHRVEEALAAASDHGDLARWRARCASECDSAARDSAPAGAERARAMRSVNPYVIARNHRVEEALAAASDHGNLAPFERLLDALGRPFDEDDALAPYAEPAPAAVTACYRTFCGT